MIRGEACAVVDADWDGILYRRQPPEGEARPLTAVPYYLWDNRECGQMQVWMHEVSGVVDEHLEGR